MEGRGCSRRRGGKSSLADRPWSLVTRDLAVGAEEGEDGVLVVRQDHVALRVELQDQVVARLVAGGGGGPVRQREVATPEWHPWLGGIVEPKSDAMVAEQRVDQAQSQQQQNPSIPYPSPPPAPSPTPHLLAIRLTGEAGRQGGILAG